MKGLFLLTALFILNLTYAQNVGIGTSTPIALLHVADSNVLFTGPVTVPATTTYYPPTQGAGTRMMWYPQKAALRVGVVDGTQWDKDSIGRYSIAIGNNTKAIAEGSFASGVNAIARGATSVSMGFQTIASGGGSVSIGNNTVAFGNYSASFGQTTKAYGEASTSIGYHTSASGDASTSMGYFTSAIGFRSTSMGYLTSAIGYQSTSMGTNTNAKAGGSTSMGFYTNAESTNSLVIGEYNDTTNTNRFFEIGNGTANNARSNAMTVLKNGNVGIGTVSPTNQTEIVGTAVATPVTLVIGNRNSFGPAALEFVSDYGTGNQWRPGYIKTNDIGSFTGSLEFYTNGTGAGNLYGNVKGLEVRNGVTYTATGSVSSWSDIRLKKDIQPFTKGLDIINQINPVSFYYNEQSPFQTEKMQIGILAQELEKIAPYMVDKNVTKDFDDLRSVNNQAYIFLLINAVKEQQKQIDEQRKMIQQLINK